MDRILALDSARRAGPEIPGGNAPAFGWLVADLFAMRVSALLVSSQIKAKQQTLDKLVR
jgi:hypothetical protein